MRRLTATTLSVLAALPVVIYTALHGYAGTRLDVLLLCDAVVRRQSVPSLRSYADVQPRHTVSASTGGTWHLAWGKGLSVSFEGSGGESVELLRTAPGAAFVAAAASERVAAEARGCFWVRDRVLAACVAQRVDSVTAPPGGGLLLSGGFDDCPAAQWRLHLGHDKLGHATPPRGEAEAGGAEAAASAGTEAARELRFALDVEGVSPAGAPLNRAQLAYGARRGAAYWGMGSQFTHFNLRGHCVPACALPRGSNRVRPTVGRWPWGGGEGLPRAAMMGEGRGDGPREASRAHTHAHTLALPRPAAACRRLPRPAAWWALGEQGAHALMAHAAEAVRACVAQSCPSRASGAARARPSR